MPFPLLEHTFQQGMIGPVNHISFERHEVDFGGADGVVPQCLTDDGHGKVVLPRHGRPTVTTDIGGEMQTSKHTAQFFQGFVVEAKGVLILPIHLLRVSLFREDGQEIGGVGGVTIEDVAHEGFDKHFDALPCLASDIADDPTPQVGFLKECHVDEGDATHTEAEEEKVAGEL